jgi:HAE1 family hydrophobic/amphiphilic exporter-1
MIATGAGAASRQSIGTTVFGGMVAATVLTLLFVPVFYAVIEGLRERGHSGGHEHEADHPAVAEAAE